MASGSSKSILYNGSTDFAKLGDVSVRLLPKMLRQLLERKEPSTLLFSHVQNNRYLRYNLKPYEIALIAKSHTKGYLDFDVPLLYKLIRNLACVPHPTKGWSSPYDPAPTELTIGDDVERIRRTRNNIVHRGYTNVSENELSDYFLALKSVASRFEIYLGEQNGHFVSDFEDLEKYNIFDQVQNITKNLGDIRNREMQLSEEIAVLSTRDSHVLQIDSWKMADSKFVETIIVQEIEHKLKTQNSLLVTGPSGTGKSAHIYHAALKLHSLEGYQIVPCFHPSDILNYFKTNINQVFVIDDVGGRYTITNDIEDWLKYEDIILSLVGKSGKKMLASCRLQVFSEDQFQRLKLFKMCFIELSDRMLTSEVKLKIAEQYLSDEIVNCLKPIIKDYKLFPLLCSRFTEDPNCDISNFLNPYPFYEKEFNKLLGLKNKSKYFALVLFVLCNGLLVFHRGPENPVRKQQNEETLDSLFKDCNVRPGTSKMSIINHLDSFVGTFIKRKSKINEYGLETVVVYTPLNDEIFDFMAYHIGMNKQEVFLKYANSLIISKRTRLWFTNEVEDEFAIVIQKRCEQVYFERILRDLRQGNSKSVFQSGQIQNPTFCEKLHNVMEVAFRRKKLENHDLFHIFDSENKNLIDFAERKVGCFKSLVRAAYSTRDTGIVNIFKRSNNVNKDCIQCKVLDCTGWYTPLICACYHGHEYILQKLIFQGASINKRSSSRGVTPLIVAIFKKQKRVVMALYNSDTCSLTKRDNNGRSPLIWACHVGFKFFITLYFVKHTELNTVDKNGQTALMHACRNGHLDIVHFLIQHGASINTRSKKGWTALMMACRGVHEETIRFLVENGADINVVDREGGSALSIAKFRGTARIVEYLNIQIDNCQHKFPESDIESPESITLTISNAEKAKLSSIEETVLHENAV